MPPYIAAFVFALGILMLFRLDRDPRARVSPAIWIPVTWLSIGASRMVSQWLGSQTTMTSPEQLLDGSPLDAFILACLLLAGLIVLIARSGRTQKFLRANGPILIFLLFTVISVTWSDYPFVAFKRWTKLFGNVVMVMVVLTDRNPSAAVKRLLAWSGFLLVPFSVLFVKYFPALGVGYHEWTWTRTYQGVALGKNGLGTICLLFGLAALWRLLEVFPSRERRMRTRAIVAHGTILVMALWLLWKADSATSLGCLLAGATLLAITTLSRLGRKPAVVHGLVVVFIFIAVFGLIIDTNAGLVTAVGRDTTLTGRTAIWTELFHLNVNSWVGTGFESFWLGGRAEHFWNIYAWHPNQAHNGYIETLINLGWIGVAFLGFLMFWGYRNVIRFLRQDGELGRLRLAFFLVAALYNFTEAAFKVMHPVWIIFLLAIAALPNYSARRAVIHEPGLLLPDRDVLSVAR